MTPFFYIYIRCQGRLANQLLSWVKGRHVTRHLNNRKLLINYAELGQCVLPNTDNRIMDTSAWPESDTKGLASCQGNCVWTEVWDNFPPNHEMRTYLYQIQFDNTILDKVKDGLGAEGTIGVHIRYGDFLSVDPNNPITIPSFVRAPNEYYTAMVDQCRELLPKHKIFLATDGTPDEVKWFTDRYHPLEHANKIALLDLLTLSRCDIIVGSNSTFSLIASILGKKPITVPGCTIEQVRQLIPKS